MSLEEALSYHGLTRETLTAEMIRWTDSIRLESPALYDAITYDPPEIKQRMNIKIWDFAFSSGMTTDYPVRRGWNPFMGVREIVQNSLAYSEPILVMENGEIKLEKIGDFVEKHLKEGETEGKVDGVYTLSFVPSHRGKGWVLRWLPITRVYKHRFNGDMFKVTLETGRSISVTGAHSLFKLYKREVDKNELHAVPISTKYYPYATYGGLHIGDLVALPFTRMEPTMNEEIDLLEELAKLPESITEHIDVDDSQYFLSNKFAVEKDQIKCNRVPLNLWRKFRYPLPKRIALSGKHSPSKIKRMLPVRPFLRFLGFYMAEGCIPNDNDRRPYIILSFGSHEAKLIREVEEILGELGEISYSICKPHETAVNIEVYSEPLAIYLEYCLKVGTNSLEKKLPNILFNMNWSLVKEFLDYYFKGDGYHHNRMNRWIVSTSSKELATGLIYLLSLNQVSFSLEEKEEKEVKIGDRRVTQEKSYYFYIYEGALSGKRGGRASRRQNGDLTFLRVIKIEPCEYNHQWVYDVSVPEAENFVAGTGCFMVHNSLDIEERLFSYEGISVKIWVDELGLHVADRGPGITYDAFKLGASDKSCWERGFFGEGLKVGMAFFVHIGQPIYVFNRRGQVFKAVVSPGTGLVIIAMGRANPVTGTEAIVYGYRPDVESVRRIIFQEWMKDVNFYIVSKTMRMTDACRFNRPHFIISHVDRKSNVDFLWVRDISVNKLSALTRHPSIFGYNIWYVTLEPNRVAVSSIPELAREIAISFTPEAVEELLNRVVSNSSIKRDLFEVEDVNWWYASDEVREKVAAWIKERKYGWTDNERAVDWALYLGAKPLIVPYTMTELFGRAQTLEDVIIVKGMERIEAAEGSVVSRENLTLKEACYLRGAEIILTDIHISLVGVDKPMPAILVAEKMDAAGTATVDRIYIHRDSLYGSDEALRTALHEYGHYYGRRTYREARDLSEAFERSLTTIAAEAVRISAEARQAFYRAVNGAWGAKAHEWKAGRYRRLDPLSVRLNEALRLQLQRIFNIPEARVKFTSDIMYRIDESPSLIVTVSLSKADEELIMRGIYVELDYASYTPKHHVSDILEWRIPYPRLDLYMAVAERTLKDIEAEKTAEPTRTHIIFIYNPANDEYDVWRSLRRRT